MATDKNYKADRAKEIAHEAKEGLLQDLTLLALPVLAFQRNMLNVVKKGIEQAGALKPVATLAASELHALFMILDPAGKWRDSVGAEIEKKMKDALDAAVPKGVSGAVKLIDAQTDLLTALIYALNAVRQDPAPKGSRKRS